MTPQTSAAARLTLDQATTDETLATIFGAQRLDPERSPTQVQTQRDAGAALISALHPRDPVEATYAARAAAAHYGSMECFRRAMLPDMPDSLGLRWHGKAVALSRMNTEMVRALKQCQAETPGAQPQPGARPAVPPPPSGEDRLKAALAAELARRQACPRALDPRDPMSSERPSSAPAASTTAAQPAATASGRDHPMPSERPSFTPAASTSAPKPAATGSGRHPCPRALDPRDTMPSERPSFTPAASVIMTQPGPTSFLSAPPPHQGLRAELLGSAADVAAMLAAATVQATPHVQ